MVLGHDITDGHRTKDVQITEDVSFDTMLLGQNTLKGLKTAGFLNPSPIQLHGIPLGKCGFDLLLEAKSGTGKTAVFTVIALEKLDLNKGVQTIILAPTREIAWQISDVITEVGSQYKGLNVAVVMGGLPVKEDIEKFSKNVHIVVGSPGRLRHLIQSKHISLSAVRLLVLDEADKLMENSFQRDINYIFSHLPKDKQVVMSSATYSEITKTFIDKYVQKAQHVCPDSNNILLGIEQKVIIVPHNNSIVKQTELKYKELVKILNSKQFKQCLIFCNYIVRVGEVHKMLSRNKWPAEQLYGQQDQTDRLGALKTLQEYKCRILVATDLAARGIDASNVDIVINFEPPYEWETYLHRIGRAGRYGSCGTAISILSEGKELAKFKETLAPTNIPFNLCHLWDDKPFNLNLIEDTRKTDEPPITISAKIASPQNGNKLEDMLWKALVSGSLEKQDNHPEITNSVELDSLKISNETNTETFSDLMHSFKVDQNEISNNSDSIQFKHVKFAKLPIDVVKYWDNLYTMHQVNGHPNVDILLSKKSSNIITNLTNGDYVNGKESNGNERYLTVGMEKDISIKHLSENIEMTNSEMTEGIENYSSKKHLSEYVEMTNSETTEGMEKDSSKKHLSECGGMTNYETTKTYFKILNHNYTKSYNSLSDDQETLLKDLGRKSDAIGMDPTKKTLVNLPPAFGKNQLDKRVSRIHKYPDLNIENESHSKEISINSIKETLVDANFSTTFGKKEQNESHSKNHNNKKVAEINTSEIDYNEETLGDTNLSQTSKQDSQSRVRRYDSNLHYGENTVNTLIDPMKQALIEAGLPTAFGKNKQHRNHSRTRYYYRSNDENEPKDLEKSKANQIQQTSKIHRIDRKKLNENSSTKTFTRESSKQKQWSTKIVESDQSDSLSESSCNEENTSKFRNNYATCAGTYNTTFNHHESKTHQNSIEQNIGKQFDTWYKQLKLQAQSIQYTLYIEELQNL